MATLLGGLLAGGGVGGILILGLYLLPTIIGASRKVVNIGSVAAINLLLGWTLIGWVVALAMALRTNPPHAYQQFWQGTAPGGAGAAGQQTPSGSGPRPNSYPAEGPTQPPPPSSNAGWYKDPWGVGKRWWNGRFWTDQTAG